MLRRPNVAVVGEERRRDSEENIFGGGRGSSSGELLRCLTDHVGRRSEAEMVKGRPSSAGRVVSAGSERQHVGSLASL